MSLKFNIYFIIVYLLFLPGNRFSWDSYVIFTIYFTIPQWNIVLFNMKQASILVLALLLVIYASGISVRKNGHYLDQRHEVSN